MQALLTEYCSTLEGGCWVHRATICLFHDTGTDLNLRLPERAQAVAVILDGAAVLTSPPPSRPLWLLLPGRAETNVVQVLWRYPDGIERFEKPNLSQPVIEGAEAGPTFWMVERPLGYHLKAKGGEQSAKERARLDLRRAAAYLEASRRIATQQAAEAADNTAPQLRSAQNAFYRFCASAELRTGNSSAAAILESLKEQNQRLARQYGFERIAARAERRRFTEILQPDASPPTAGARVVSEARAIHWRAPMPEFVWISDEPSPPAVEWVSDKSSTWVKAVIQASVLIIFSISIFAVASSSRLQPLTRRFREYFNLFL
jgi:hypothetical protein